MFVSIPKGFAMNMIERLEQIAAGPKPWRVTTTYDHGGTRVLDQPFEASARNYAERDSRKIGRCLIDRETGKTVRIVSVTVDRIQ